MKRLCYVLCFSLIATLAISDSGMCEELRMSEDYIIHPSDVLEISIYGEADMVRELVVRPDGNVSFPLIGDIKVAGFSTTSVKQRIDDQVSKYIPEASSTVIVNSLGSLKYYVVGEVANPGMFNVSTEVTVPNGGSVSLGGLGQNDEFYRRYLFGIDKGGRTESVDIVLTPQVLQMQPVTSTEAEHTWEPTLRRPTCP